MFGGPPQVPPNGLVVYTGTILTEEGKERKVNIDFEPFKPINTSLYLCDNKFHTEALNELLESDCKCAPGHRTPAPGPEGCRRTAAVLPSWACSRKDRRRARLTGG